MADDGTGFEPDKVSLEDHFGLKIMDEQVTWLGGSLTIDSSPGYSTRVVAVLPTTGRGEQEDGNG